MSMIFSKSSILSIGTNGSRIGLSKIYRVPVPSQLWGEPQKEHITNWAELFFDLIYVAVAFQEGKLVAGAIKDGRLVSGIFVFLVTFMCLFDGWSHRLQYSSRFHNRDISHKLLDIVNMMVVAASALHLDVLDTFTNLETYHIFAFSVLQTASYAQIMLRGLELQVMSPTPQVRGTGETMIRRSLVPILCFAASVYTAVPQAGLPWQVSVLLWLSATISLRLDLILRIYFGSYLPKWWRGIVGKDRSTPMNIEFSIHRYGEWTMLMLGEGVLQLIVVPVELSTNFYAEFALGYLLMALLQLLHFSTSPNHPEGHVMRRSARRVVFWTLCEVLYSASLTTIGVGLKLALTYASDEKKVKQYASKLLCYSTGSAIMLLWLCRLCHAGPKQELFDVKGKARVKKVLIWILKFLTPCVVYAAPLYQVPVVPLISINVAVVVLAFAIQVKDTRLFGDSLRVSHHHPSETSISHTINAEGPGQGPNSTWVCDELGVPTSLQWQGVTTEVARQRIAQFQRKIQELEQTILQREEAESEKSESCPGGEEMVSAIIPGQSHRRRSSLLDPDNPKTFLENEF